VRLAAIDIGTNSIRLRVVDVPVGGARRTLDDEKAYTRIGRGMSATGRLSEDAMDDAIVALRRMLSIAGQHDVTDIRAVATAAVRSAENAGEFVGRIRAELGLVVEVISAEEEGRLAFLSAAESVPIDGRCAVIDIGGGSVEVVHATDGQITRIASLPVGAVAMSERFHTIDPMPKEDRRRLAKHVRKRLAAALGDENEPVARLIGSGGTVNTIAALIAARHRLNLTSVHTFEIRRAELIHLLAPLSRSSALERAGMKGMPENRVDIIVAGAIVLDETMRFLGANELIVNARGMREGIVIDMVARERGVDASPDRMQAVREWGRRFHTDYAHAEQVCRLALQLFDFLRAPLGLVADDRQLLETAALLHDVGYHISYERHHKHAYHLISHSEIPGFTASEIRMIAGVARYHRGAQPKVRHESMSELDSRERERVSRLAAIIRLADGLDRSRGQRIDALDLTLTGSMLVVGVCGDGPLDVEVYGAQRKTDLFETVFGTSVEVVEAGERVCPGTEAVPRASSEGTAT